MTSSRGGESTGRQKLGPALAALAAALLVASALSTSWWSASSPAAGGETLDYQVGLYRAELCTDGSCHGRALADLGIDASWGRTTLAAMAGALVAAMLLVVVAATFSSTGPSRRVGWVAAVMVLFTASMVVIAHLRNPFTEVQPGWAFIAGFAGLAAGLLAAGLRLLRARES